MPFELVADGPGHASMRPYEDPELNPDQVRMRTLLGTVKHGTEFRSIRTDSPDFQRPWDPAVRVHRRDAAPAQPRFPQPLGNMCFGIVTEIGRNVSGIGVGDRVFGFLPARQTHVLGIDKVRKAPLRASGPALMYVDPATFALGAIRDGHIRLGDRVAVFGLGAIGQMAVQLARLAGARTVFAIDPIELRRRAAGRHGADDPLDPTTADPGLEIKKRTNGAGVDVAIETSGSSDALYDALRSIRYAGTIVGTAYYATPMTGLLFAGEFHRNRPRIISSRANSEPNPDFGWDLGRIEAEVTDLLGEGRLDVDGLLHPVVPVGKAAEAFQHIYEHPEQSIKLGIDFEAEPNAVSDPADRWGDG